MKVKVAAIFIMLSIIALVSCSGGGGGGGNSTNQSSSVSGCWFVSSNDPTGSGAYLSLLHNGSAVTGSFVSPGGHTVNLSGSTSGNGISLSFNDGGCVNQLTGTIAGNTMGGNGSRTVNLNLGACSVGPWTGTWNMARVSNNSCSSSVTNNVLAWYEDPNQSSTVTIIGEAVPGASAYHLYQSTDGTNYVQVTSFVSTTLVGQAAFAFEVNVPQNTYFRTTATVSGAETTQSVPVFLDYANRNSLPLITITTPTNNQTNVSLTPTFTWTPSSGATEYVILMEEMPFGTGLGVLLKKCTTTSWAYGSTAGISLTYLDTLSSLKPSTQYSFIVWAIDSTGTMKAIAKSVQFTTSP